MMMMMVMFLITYLVYEEFFFRFKVKVETLSKLNKMYTFSKTHKYIKRIQKQKKRDLIIKLLKFAFLKRKL